jgi:hypothetical protein
MRVAGERVRWIGVVAVGAAASAVLVLLPAVPAHAHPPGIEAAVDYRVRVTSVRPEADGVRVRFVADGSRLELRSDPPRTVEVLGYDGEPMLRVGPDGAWENALAPSLYVDQPGAATRAGASPGAQPQWRRVGDQNLVRWQDHRALWHGGPPPQVATDPGRAHRVLDWAVPIRVDGEQVKIIGFTEWVPPPRAGDWWLAVLLLVAALVVAGRVAHRYPAAARLGSGAVALAVGLAAIGYQVLVVVDNAEPGGFAVALLSRAAPLVVGLALVAGAVLTWLRRGSSSGFFLLAIGGPLIAFLAGLENVALLSHSVAPVSLDPLWARLAEVLVLGGGLGLLGFTLARARGGREPDAGGRRLLQAS